MFAIRRSPRVTLRSFRLFATLHGAINHFAEPFDRKPISYATLITAAVVVDDDDGGGGGGDGSEDDEEPAAAIYLTFLPSKK